MIETHQLCVEPSCARRAAHGLLLCWPDRDRLARLLDPDNHGGLDPARPGLGELPGGIAASYRAAAQVSHRTGTEQPHELADHARVDDRAIAMRDVRTSATGPGPDDDGEHGPRSVLAALGGWARVVHEERADPLPALGSPTRKTSAPAPDVRAVEVLCRWLHQRVDWIAAQPWIDDALVDLAQVASQLRRASGAPTGRHLGPCPALLDEEGQLDPLGHVVCGAPLHAPIAGARDPGPLDLPTIRCSRCSAVYRGAALIDVARTRGLIDWSDALAPPQCPVHDLPTERPVRTRVTGTLLEGTAAEVCRTWHAHFESAG